jgi:hypothetical protein
MTAQVLAPLPPATRQQLAFAVTQLERPSWVVPLARVSGAPVDLAIKYMPRTINVRLRGAIEAAIYRCFEAAVNSFEEDDPLDAPAPWMGKLMTGVTGGVGGFFGPWALPIELPITTALMLRGIAEIARDEGEDLTDFETKLACLEVFALGGGPGERGGLNLEYYAVRAAIAQLTREAARQMVERGAINASTPIMARLIGEIVGRFGLAIGDRFASGMVPMIGAVGGATVNMIFMDHFQRVARGHFIVRRLERQFGTTLVRTHYRAQALALRNRRGLAAVPS